jgi:bis(5'-nucleosyl)-tetraphosphatase (symmetrical)
MATWVLGDVHGRHAALERLLSRLGLDAGRDRLWLVGDLVNRGPESLAALRWARRAGERWGARFAMVLGNHDLKLLALAAGVEEPGPRDTLDDVLAAPDRDELLAWLRRRPLLHRDGGDVLVHAGLLPSWTVVEAEARAREVEEELKDDGSARLLADWRSERPADEAGRERRRRTLDVLVGIRTCRRDGGRWELCDWSGPPETAPPGCLPWFDAPERASAGARIVFGHWAALGLHLKPRIKALDAGAAWGGRLAALRLDDGEVVQEQV